MSNQNANFNLMTNVARHAGNALLRDFMEVQRLIGSISGTGRIANRARIRTENNIRHELHEARQKYGYSSEFSGDEPGSDTSRKWLVSPIAGFGNFLNGIPHWAVSIALMERGVGKLAVIYDPYKNEMFRAEKGRGAYVNNVRLRTAPKNKPVEFIVSIGKLDSRCCVDIATLDSMVDALRISGAPALDLAYLSAGRLDGHLGCAQSTPDQVAGLIILAESGGLSATMPGLSPGFGCYYAAGNTGFDNFVKVMERAMGNRTDG